MLRHVRRALILAVLSAVLPLDGVAAPPAADMQLGPSSSGQKGAAIGSQLGTYGAGAARGTGLSGAYHSIGASATPGSGPAQGGVVSATASRTTALTLDCSRSSAPSPGSGLLAYPLGIETACIKTGSGQYVVDLCPATEGGSSCTASSGWIQQRITPNGTFRAGSKIRLVVGACPNDQCAVTMTQTGAFQGTGAGFKQQGYQSIARSTASGNAAGAVYGMGVYAPNGQPILSGRNPNSGAMYGTMLAQGNVLLSCRSKQQKALEAGKPMYTCSGSASVLFGGQSCKNTTSCVKWQTATKTWTESCTASLSQSKSTCTTTTPVSQTTCTTTTPEEQCTLANQAIQEQCSIDYTPTIVAKPSCTPNTWVYVAPIYDKVWDPNTSNYTVEPWTGAAYYLCDPSNKSRIKFRFVSPGGNNLYITVPTTYYLVQSGASTVHVHYYAGNCYYSGCLPPLYQSGIQGWWPAHTSFGGLFNWVIANSSFETPVRYSYIGCASDGKCQFVFGGYAAFLWEGVYSDMQFDLPRMVYSAGTTTKTDGCALYGG